MKNKAKHLFEQKAVTINQILGRQTSLEEVKDAFKKGFEKGLDIEFTSYQPNEQMLEEIKELMRTKYESEKYTFQR